MTKASLAQELEPGKVMLGDVPFTSPVVLKTKLHAKKPIQTPFYIEERPTSDKKTEPISALRSRKGRPQTQLTKISENSLKESNKSQPEGSSKESEKTEHKKQQK